MSFKMIAKSCKAGLLICTLSLTPCGIQSQDPCLDYDECMDAIDLGLIPTGDWNVNEIGCNLYASPDTLISGCLMGDYPTVWYKFTTDLEAASISITISSDDFEMPAFSLFESPNNGCSELEPVLLRYTTYCIIGSDGLAKVSGARIDTSSTLYLAVSSHLSIGGDFSIHMRILPEGFICVKDRSLKITHRSNEGPLEGPFDPNEEVRVCLNVEAFVAANNGCQWFQGLVPVFGNGWDPSSFDSLGQPMNATVNDLPIGEPGNGLYGLGSELATWDWFDDVDYHHDYDDLTIGDFDNNGRMDMCNSHYDPECPFEGIKGGCCEACWGNPLGDTLPAGWFAYGINGSCPNPGPPIRVDWGDGNACNEEIMGPWEFCFDLITRDILDCAEDSTTRDLSIGFLTFADGEIGAWTGNSSVCSNDAPLNLSFEASCGRITNLDPEILAPLNSGDTLFYLIEEPDILDWEWNISPFWAVPYLQNTGQNGFTLSAPLVNTTGDTVDITGIFIGKYGPDLVESNDRLVKKIKFKLISETPTAVSPDATKANQSEKIKLYPMPVSETVTLEWSFILMHVALIRIYDFHGQEVAQMDVVPANLQRTQFSTAGLPPGIYYVSFSNADFKYVTKMVKI